MTITGKVFLFLTLILAVIFPALAQPVFQYRAANQKAYAAERDKLFGTYEGDKRVPGLLEKAAELERRRAQLRRLVALEETRRVTGEENTRRLLLSKETDIAFMQEAREDSKQRSAAWKSALAQTENEINARDAEIKQMDADVQQAKAFSMELAQQVSDLKAKLEAAKTQTQKLAAELEEREKALAGIMKSQPDVESDIALGR